MKYIIREEIINFGDKYIVQDENKNTILIVKTPNFTWGNILNINDVHGNFKGYIKQHIFSLRRKFSVYYDGKLIATISSCKIIKEGEHYYAAKVNYAIPDIPYFGFRVTSNSKVIGAVVKKYSNPDFFNIEVINDEDSIILFAFAIILGWY